ASGEGMGEAAEARPEAEPKAEGRLGRFLRRALRWAAAAGAVFALGVAATWFAQVRPRTQQIEALIQALAEVEAQRDQLQEQVAELEGVRSENKALQASLREAQARLDLLSILVDVTTAQLAIAEEDPIAAKVALEETDQTLRDLGEKLDPREASAIASLRERVGLVLGEIDADIFAAQRDLEVLANSLLEIEREHFGS
ncbi:MAG: hypothetical protein AAB321_01205, partial [Chloroflexota bacterium]